MNSGFLLVNKPSGPTSHDIIGQLRRITGIKKIGHAGTLDPFASGLLIVGVGREATRRLSEFFKLDKEYIAILKLGFVSDTFDREGKITTLSSRAESRQSRDGVERSLANADSNPDELGDSSTALGMTKDKIKKTLNKFRGEIEQVPPMYSAKKVKGKKLYELARKGEEIERQAVKVNINNLEIIKYKWPILKIKCEVSSGTYIRSLAHDIGQQLGIGAYLEELQRTGIGVYNINKAIELKNINQKNWQQHIKNLSNE